MKYTIASRREHGAPYVRYSIILNGEVIYAQLGPISDADAAKRVRAHLNPQPRRPVPEFVKNKGGRPAKGRPTSNEVFDDEAA